MKLGKSLENESYEEWLGELGLLSLEKWMLRQNSWEIDSQLANLLQKVCLSVMKVKKKLG